ncbi:phosphotransferase family protein [Haloechinothrix sp. LS1_15]|nr:phosphotransferase family protein [Haloechinothrix sp. LS1_15]MDV6013700.1 phosphotransferase family protein [Haloechinothrix sp. LS1_15]
MDTPGEVRDEDAFDVDAVHAWLAARLDGLDGPPAVRQFARGASNLTYLLRYPDRDLVLRRPPAGEKAASAHDMGREYRVQAGLKPVFGYVPEVLAFCDDPGVIGSEFYVMQRLTGIILRSDPPEGMEVDAGQARTLAERFVDTLVELHNVDPRAAGLADLGKGAGYVHRQITGWSDRYRRARTDNVGDFENVMRWLAANEPDDVRTCLIHNDFRFDNIVFDAPGTWRVVGVLDWEMATLGDPLMELGATLAYWVQADDDEVMHASRRQPTHLPGMLTRKQIVERYAQLTGLYPEHWTFYEVYGLFRLAVIIQQIYRRYHDGQTTNPAFAEFWMFVGYLEDRCERIIEQGGSL